MTCYSGVLSICLVHAVLSHIFYNQMRISSYNCQSSKRNIGGIKLLCDVSDIVLLQEHWLYPFDLPSLNTLHKDFMTFGISSIDVSDGIVLGRPYGGVAVMWRKDLTSQVKPISFDDRRIIGLECCFNGIKMLLLGVYLPYNATHNFDEFVFSLGKIRSIIDEFDSPYVFVFGDFNADIERQTSFGKELDSFCQESDLIVADPVFLGRGSVTHVNDAHGTESWLDHIVCTKGAYGLIQAIDIRYSISSSDHFPMTAELRIPSGVSVTPDDLDRENFKWVVDWSTVDRARLELYTAGVNERLNEINAPLNVLKCNDTRCVDHCSDIDRYYSEIISCLHESSRHSIAREVRGGHKPVPGWSEFVQKAHSTLGDIYCLWAIVGKPKTGYIYDQLRLAKARFKYSLRWCIRNDKDLRARNLADKLARYPRDPASFWKEVRNLNSSPPLATTVNAVSGTKDIAHMWKDHFSGILNSVCDDTLKESVLHRVRENMGVVHNISVQEVSNSLRDLASGRSSGHDGLSAEHFKHAGHMCLTHLSLCFTMMLKHGYLPKSLTKVVIVPIVKDKTGNISDKDNYRPIALASVSSKVLESIVLNRSRDVFCTSDHQFGFKPSHSTDMAIYAVKELSEYYLRNNSPVFLCFLDAKKAFDRVNHWKLFDKLLCRGMDACLVNLLVEWYGTQSFHTQWGQYVTSGFTVCNGVRQGGILSPFLFNLYVDSLSVSLDNTGVGCRYLGSMNHIAYADDMILLSPTPFGLQVLLNTCEKYANEHDIVYNTKKTVCMCLRPKMFKNMCLPQLTLCGETLKYVNSYKYLGFNISEDSTDNLEIQQQYRLLCCRTNSLIRKFSMCSYQVKKFLYMSYCATVYCLHLWHVFNVSVINKFKVCLNNAARMFFGYERFCSASAMHVREGIDSFDVMFRKSSWIFLRRLGLTKNTVLSALVNSDVSIRSRYRAVWNRALLAV